jgi:hypothetical protein
MGLPPAGESVRVHLVCPGCLTECDFAHGVSDAPLTALVVSICAWCGCWCTLDQRSMQLHLAPAAVLDVVAQDPSAARAALAFTLSRTERLLGAI